MSTFRSVVRGAATHYATQAATLVIGLVTTRLVVTLLSRAEYGQWLIAQQIIAYLALLDLGMLAIVQRDVARLNRHDEATPRYATRVLRRLLALAAVAAIVSATIWVHLPDEWAELRSPLAVMFAALSAVFPLRYFPAALAGTGHFSFLAVNNFCSWLVGTGVSLGLLFAGAGLMAVAAGWCVTQVLQLGVAVVYARRQEPQLLPRFGYAASDPNTSRELTDALWRWIDGVALTLSGAVDVFLIGRLLGPEATVAYACTAKLPQLLTNVSVGVTHMSQTLVAQAHGAGDRVAVRDRSHALLVGHLIIVGGVVAVCAACNEQFVRMWLGSEEYFSGHVVNAALLVVLAGRQANMALYACLFNLGRNGYLPAVTITDGLLTVVGTYFLVGRLGPLGAPLAGLAVVGLFTLPLNTFTLARTLDEPVGSLGRRLIGVGLRGAMVTAVGFAGGVWLSNLDGGLRVVITAVWTSAIACVYGITMYGPVKGTALGPKLKATLRAVRLWFSNPSVSGGHPTGQ